MATDGLAKSAGTDVSASSRAELDSTDVDKNDERYALQTVMITIY